MHPTHTHVDMLKDLFDKFYPMFNMVCFSNNVAGAWENGHFNVLAVSLNSLLKFITTSFVWNMLFAILLGKLTVRGLMVLKFLLIESTESDLISSLWKNKQ